MDSIINKLQRELGRDLDLRKQQTTMLEQDMDEEKKHEKE